MGSRTDKMTTRFRRLLKEEEIIVSPSVFSPFTARIAERVGFKAIGIGGYALGAHLTTTEPLMTMSEVLDASRSIASSVNIPVIVDAGAGFGEPVHVARTVREFERTGVAGIHIEDQIFPKRAHYHRDYREHIIPVEDMVGKIRIACEYREDRDFVLIARTDALKTDGFEETVNRANTYVKEGADMIMLFPNNLDEARRLPKVINAPLIYVNSEGGRVGRPILTIERAKEFGYRMLEDAIGTVIVTYTAIKDMYERLRSTGVAGLDQSKAVPARKEIEEMIGLSTYYRIEEITTEKKR